MTTETAPLAWVETKRRPDTFAEELSKRRWTLYDHLGHVAGRCIDALENRAGGRLIINMGPGTGKSQFVSHWFPAWYLSEFPSNRVILSTATQPLATSWGKAVRETITEHSDLLGVSLDESSKAKNEWTTNHGGGMRAVGAGVALMGYRANLFIVDDPYGSWEDAWSHTYRRKVEEWFDATMNSRLEPGAAVVVLHHRLHPHDLTWFLTESGRDERWDVVRLPSLAEAGDPLGRRPGDAICPQRFSVQALERRRRVNPVVFSAMDQQSPKATGIGSVYDRFTAANLDHTLTLDRRRGVCVTMDFNVNPGMHVLVGQYDATKDLFTYVHEIHGPRMNLGQAMDDLCKLIGPPIDCKGIEVFGDATGAASKIDDGRSLWDVVRQRLTRERYKFTMRVPGANPGVIPRVLAVNDALSDADGVPHIKVHPRCERLLADLRESRQDADGLPQEGTGLIGHAVVAVGYQVHKVRPLGGRIVIPRGRFAV